MTADIPTFLLVDDNDLDAEKVVRTLDRMQLEHHLVRAHHGIEALDLIRGTNSVDALEWPYILLLDLNMPRMDGIEMLKELHTDASQRIPPIFIMTTSSRPGDICGAYRFQICDYVVKPLNEGEFERILRSAREYWERSCLTPQSLLEP